MSSVRACFLFPHVVGFKGLKQYENYHYFNRMGEIFFLFHANISTHVKTIWKRISIPYS